MNILQKMKEKEAVYENLKSAIEERDNIIKTNQAEINEIVDAIKRTQGEYAMLTEIGRETGVLDESNNPIEVETVEEETLTVE
jgi:hypothetical protein